MEKPKIGELYRTSLGNIIKVVEFAEVDDEVFYIILNMKPVKYPWLWTSYPLRKLSPLEQELY